MSTLSTNLSLPKAEGTDNFTRESYNNLIDTIDNNCASKDNFNNYVSYPTAGGTATAITLTLPTLTNGLSKTFIASADNSGSATTINGKPLYKPNTTTAPVIVSGKAYTVWYNSTGDCFFIKTSEGGDSKFPNILKYGNMSDSASALLTWQANASTNTIASNTLTNTGNGSASTPNTQQRLILNIYAGQKFYLRATVKVTNANCNFISLYTYDGTNQITAQSISNPVQGQEYTLSGICTQVATSSNLYAYILHSYTNATTANGKSMEVSKFMVSDITGNELTKAELDAIVIKNSGWWDSDLAILTADANVTSAQMITSYKGYNNGVLVTGAIPLKGTATYSPSTSTQTISSGQYLSGTQTILAVTGTATVDKVDAGYTFSSASGINLTGTSTKKRWLSGTASSISVTTFTLNNIGFTPSCIVIRCMTTVSSNAYEIVSVYNSGIYQSVATYSRINTSTYSPEGNYGSYSAKIPVWSVGSGTFSFSTNPTYTFTEAKYWVYE